MLRSSLEAISFPLPSHKITFAFNSKSSETVSSGFTEILKLPAESLILEKDGADTLQICLKNGTNFYWYALQTENTGSGGEITPDPSVTNAILDSTILGQVILGKET